MARHVCIVGGGISGLASALFLRKCENIGKITLLEGSGRFGGWLNSEHVTVEKGTSVLLEHGTRTLSFKSSNKPGFISLIQELRHADELRGKMLCLARGSPVNKNKFVVYQGRTTPLPTGLLSALMNPLTRQLPLSVAKDISLSFKRQSVYDGCDVSVYNMFSRFDKRVADYLVGSFIHGVYGGDVHMWSGEMSFGWLLKHLRTRNSFTCAALAALREALAKKHRLDAHDHDDLDLLLKKSALMTFEGGMSTLIEAIVEELGASDKISLQANTRCTTIENKDGYLCVRLAGGESISTDEIISCVPSFELSRLTLTEPDKSIRYQSLTPVHVILRKKRRESKLKVQGKESFGILNPIVESRDFTGIIFESSAFPTKQSNPDIQVVTVMLKDVSETRDNMKAIALKIFNNHIDTYLDDFAVVDIISHENDNAIPQFDIGHRRTIESWQSHLDHKFDEKLHILSAFSSGIGVPDCIQAAHYLVEKMCIYK